MIKNIVNSSLKRSNSLFSLSSKLVRRMMTSTEDCLQNVSTDVFQVSMKFILLRILNQLFYQVCGTDFFLNQLFSQKASFWYQRGEKKKWDIFHWVVFSLKIYFNKSKKDLNYISYFYPRHGLLSLLEGGPFSPNPAKGSTTANLDWSKNECSLSNMAFFLSYILFSSVAQLHSMIQST